MVYGVQLVADQQRDAKIITTNRAHANILDTAKEISIEMLVKDIIEKFRNL